MPGLSIGIAGVCVAGYFVADRLYEVASVDPVSWFATRLVNPMVASREA